MEKKKKVGRGYFEQKSIGEKQEFVLAELGATPFLVGDAKYIFSCWDLSLMIPSSWDSTVGVYNWQLFL